MKAVQAAAPGRFTWYTSYDVTKPDAEQVLTQAVKNGAQGFGEMKFHVAADGPELRRMYALAAELRVPILIHFQEVDHTPNEGTWSTGYAKTFAAVLKEYPKTTFIGHADAFWANVSGDYHNEAVYPTGPVKRGGVTDRWLSDFPNLFGDMSAVSGSTAMARDPAFTEDFLKRHQDKLIFGSDCSCADGHGAGYNNPAAPGMSGKCVARETLSCRKAVNVAGDLSEDRVGQCAQTAADSVVERESFTEDFRDADAFDIPIRRVGPVGTMSRRWHRARRKVGAYPRQELLKYDPRVQRLAGG